MAPSPTACNQPSHKKVHNSSYDIMFNDEVIISDIVLFDETIATFQRSL